MSSEVRVQNKQSLPLQTVPGLYTGRVPGLCFQASHLGFDMYFPIETMSVTPEANPRPPLPLKVMEMHYRPHSLPCGITSALPP